MLAYPNVLLLVSNEQEAAQLAHLLAPHTILTYARDFSDLRELLVRGRYDALFCPQSFHSGASREVLEEVRKRDPGLPVILLSPTWQDAECRDMLDAGVFDWLVQPYSGPALLAAIEQATSSREASAWHDTEDYLARKAS